MHTVIEDIIAPTGKSFLLAVPSRKYTPKIIDYFDTKTVHSLFPQSETHKHMNLFTRTLADITEPLLRRKKCRLIIRNLSFQATEKNILDKLSKFGPVTEVSIPTTEVTVKSSSLQRHKNKSNQNDSNNINQNQSINSEHSAEISNHSEITNTTKLVPRGFGFVTFLCEKDAKKAIGK